VLSGGWDEINVNVEGYQPREGEDMAPYSNIVSPDYFGTMRIPIVAGRDFNEHDNLKSGSVGIINQTMARYFFGNRNPIGKKFGTDSGTPPDIEIIGVVQDAKYVSLKEKPKRHFYVPVAQQPQLFDMTLHLRTNGDARPVVVASKPFGESFVLAEMFAQLLEARGHTVTRRPGVGATEVAFSALRTSSIDAYPEYTGTGLLAVLHARPEKDPATVFGRVSREFMSRFGVRWLPPLGFENTYALAISKESSLKHRISTLPELSAHASALRIGSDYEFFSRPEWFALKKSYGLQFAEQRTFDPSLMYAGIRAGSVDVISAYSTDGRLAAYNLVVLQDPHGALPPYDAVLLLAPEVAQRRDVVAALTPLVGTVADETMREANKMVDLERKPVAEAAAFLWNQKERTGKHLFNTILPSAQARVQFKLSGATWQEVSSCSLR
jgi:glycine betaine/choline ABC-type transport system substrate-binding protein